MEIGNSVQAIQPVVQAAPPPAQSDGRAAADAAAMKKDPTPDLPLPIPANGAQTALVNKSAISAKDGAQKAETADSKGMSSAERVLKPYGINMLPEKTDAPKQQTPEG